MRLPGLTTGQLTSEQAALRQSIVGGPRGQGPQLFELVDDQGRLNGPFGVMLHSPSTGTALQELGAALRYRSTLTDRVRELAVLAVAAYHRCDFEAYAHEPLARRAGLLDSQLQALAAGAEVELDDPAEVASLALVRALLADGDAPDQVYASAREALQDPGLVDLTTLVGYYSLLAVQLRVFRVPTPGTGAPADDPGRSSAG